MFEVVGAIGMYKWIQSTSLRYYAIACHLELREPFDGKAITELKEELYKLNEAHSEKIRSLEDKVKDRCSAKEKE